MPEVNPWPDTSVLDLSDTERAAVEAFVAKLAEPTPTLGGHDRFTAQGEHRLWEESDIWRRVLRVVLNATHGQGFLGKWRVGWCDHETVIAVPSDDGFPEDGWVCASCSEPFRPTHDLAGGDGQ